MVAELADVELDMGSLDLHQGIQRVGLAPGEPLPQLVGIQAVGIDPFYSSRPRPQSAEGRTIASRKCVFSSVALCHLKALLETFQTRADESSTSVCGARPCGLHSCGEMRSPFVH